MKTSVALIFFASLVTGFLADSAYAFPLSNKQDSLQPRREVVVVHESSSESEQVPHGSPGGGAPDDLGFGHRFSGFGGG